MLGGDRGRNGEPPANPVEVVDRNTDRGPYEKRNPRRKESLAERKTGTRSGGGCGRGEGRRAMGDDTLSYG